MLAQADLDSMRLAVQASLTDSAEIQRLSRQSDGLGGFTEVWGTVATVPCRVAPERGAYLTLFAEKVRGKAVYRIIVPYDSDVRTGDRLVIASGVYRAIGIQVGTYSVSAAVLAVEDE